MDKYYMKQKACKDCRVEAARMVDAGEEAPSAIVVPPGPPAPAAPDRDEMSKAVDAAGEADQQSPFTADEPSALGGLQIDEPEQKPSSAHKPTGRANLFDDDDDDIFAEKKPKPKKNLGMFEDGE